MRKLLCHVLWSQKAKTSQNYKAWPSLAWKHSRTGAAQSFSPATSAMMTYEPTSKFGAALTHTWQSRGDQYVIYTCSQHLPGSQGLQSHTSHLEKLFLFSSSVHCESLYNISWPLGWSCHSIPSHCITFQLVLDLNKIQVTRRASQTVKTASGCIC